MRRSIWATLALGVVIGGLNLAHYYATTLLPGVEAPFGLFPGGFPVAVYLALAGDTLGPNLHAMGILGVGIILGAMLSASGIGGLGILVGLGFYLPFNIVLTYTIGTILRVFTDKKIGRSFADDVGIPAAAGLIVGEALVGVTAALVAVFA